MTKDEFDKIFEACQKEAHAKFNDRLKEIDTQNIDGMQKLATSILEICNYSDSLLYSVLSKALSIEE